VLSASGPISEAGFMAQLGLTTLLTATGARGSPGGSKIRSQVALQRLRGAEAV